MKRKIILLGAIAISGLAFSQVGVNTETPKSTFDVTAKKDGSGVPIVTDIAGMQAPRLTLAQLTAKGDSMYGADQVGALIYITDASGGGNTLQRVNITTTGYYYFDNVANVWQKVGSGTLPTGLDTTNDAFVNDAGNTMVKLGTNADGTARAAGTDFVIKDTGFVGIGIAAPTHPLHVNGAIRVKNITNNTIDITSNDLGLYGQNANIYNRYVTNAGDHRFYVDAATANGFAGGNSVVAIKGTPAELINGVEAGNMGIGTGAPTTKLHIVSATAGEGFRLEDGTQGVGKVLTSAADGVASWGTTASLGLDTTNDAFVNDAANSMVKLDTKSDGSSSRATGEKFVIKDTGFLGLGTESPTNRIEIVGTGGADDNIGLTSYADGSGDAVVRFRKATGTASTPGVLTASSNLGTIEFRGYDGTDFLTRARITSYTSNSGTFATGSVPSDLAFLTGSTTIEERMRILSNGNVGIGTLSPTVKLDVNGRINAVDQVLVNKGATEGGQIKLQGQEATDSDWTIDQINNLSTPRFRIFAGSNEDNGIAISESGNVGLGTSTPNTKLHINTTTAGAGFRLVDGTQGTGKVLSSNASGNASWVTNVAVAPTIIGETDQAAPTPSGSDYAIANNTYLKRKITLPSGKWIIMVGQTFNNLKNLSSNEGYMTHIYLGGTTTSITLPAGVTRTGIMGANVIYSASGVSISTGSFLINNTNTSDVTLYLLFGSNDYFNTSSGQASKGQVATAAGENYLYAMPIN